MEMAVQLDAALKLLVDMVAEMVSGVVKTDDGGSIEIGGGVVVIVSGQVVSARRMATNMSDNQNTFPQGFKETKLT